MRASGVDTEEDSCAVLTRTDGSPKECWCFGEAVLIMELQHHRCRLHQLAVDKRLTKSELHAGERNCVSSAIPGLWVLVAMENVRACVGVAVGEVWNLFEPVMDSTEEAVTTPGL